MPSIPPLPIIHPPFSSLHNKFNSNYNQINLLLSIINFILSMRDNNVIKEHLKVSFKYPNHPSTQDTTKSILLQPKGQQKVSVNIIKQTLPPKIAAQQHTHIKKQRVQKNPDDHTIKKQCFEIQAQTLRKESNNDDNQILRNSLENGNADTSSKHYMLRTKEKSVLKEEIKYLRKMLVESQNSQNAMRLEFELYKASNEASTLALQELIKKQGLNKQQHDLQYKNLRQAMEGSESQLIAQRNLIDKLNQQLNLQRQKCFDLEKIYHQANFNNQELQHQVHSLYNEIQGQNNQLNHLNAQLNHLNAQLNHLHNYQQHFQQQNISAKQGLKAQSSQRYNLQQQNNGMRATISSYCDKISQLIANIQAMASQINMLRQGYERCLQKLQEDKVKTQHLRVQLSDMPIMKPQPQNESLLESLSSQFNKLNEFNLHLQDTYHVLINNQKIMLEEISWLKVELNNHQIRQQLLQERILKQQKAVKIKGEQTVVEKDKSANLSEQQVSSYLKAIKAQSEDTFGQQNFALKSQLQMAKQELQIMRMTYQQDIFRVKQNYQDTLQQNNRIYSKQLSLYMREIDDLMVSVHNAQQNKSKDNHQHHQYPIDTIQEEPQIDDDAQLNNNIKKDLMKYSQDLSSYNDYNNKEHQQEVPQESSEQILHDILQIDNKINSYIANFNKSQPSSPSYNQQYQKQ